MIELVKKEHKLELTASLGAGYEKGFNEGYSKGYSDGGAFYNDYWDHIQQNGELTDYSNRFVGADWTDKTFKPKYDITPTTAAEMFFSCAITDVNKRLDECGAKLDLSTGSLTKCNALMSRAKSISCPNPINVENVVSSLNSMFYMNGAIEEVHFIGVKEYHTWSSTFQNAFGLKILTIGGVIGTAFSVGQSTLLTNESVQSILNALKDLSGETAKTLTLAKITKNNLTAEQWLAAGSKNWNIA